MHAAVIEMSDNGWMNEDLTMEWIATVWNDSVDPAWKCKTNASVGYI